MRWAGHVVHMEDIGNVYKILVRKPEGKRPLGIPRYRWEDNGMDLREVEWVVQPIAVTILTELLRFITYMKSKFEYFKFLKRVSAYRKLVCDISTGFIMFCDFYWKI
jgi:hypothetical protein